MGAMLEHKKQLEDTMKGLFGGTKSAKAKPKKKAKKKLSYDMKLGIALSGTDADVYMQKKGLNPADYDMEGM